MLYGGYDTIYRSPELGGGGGKFQAVNPTYYQLAKGAYAQFGGKVHFTNAPVLGNSSPASITSTTITPTRKLTSKQPSASRKPAAATPPTTASTRSLMPIRAAISTSSSISQEKLQTSQPSLQVDLWLPVALQRIPAPGCTFYNNLPVSYVPKVTVNAGLYYGFQHNDRTILEPRFWFNTTGSQYIWSNESGSPTKTTLPSYTTANLSFNAPFVFKKQSLNARLDILNLGNAQYNEFAYISSGAYFSELAPDPNNPPSGYVNAYPGAPRMVYGTISYQF